MTLASTLKYLERVFKSCLRSDTDSVRRTAAIVTPLWTLPESYRNPSSLVQRTENSARGGHYDESKSDPMGNPQPRLWVPESRRTSCDLLILVDKPAEAVVSFDLVGLGWCATGEWS